MSSLLFTTFRRKARSLLPRAARGLNTSGSLNVLDETIQRESTVDAIAQAQINVVAALEEPGVYNEYLELVEERVASEGDKWQDFTVEKWQAAAYDGTYFDELTQDSIEFVTKFAQHYRIAGRSVTMVDVGCGTGEFVWPLVDEFRYVIGMDLNENFLDYCRGLIPERVTPHPQRSLPEFIQGDATALVDTIHDHIASEQSQTTLAEYDSDVKIVTCVGNTIGIIPEVFRRGVYEEMARVAGADGVAIMIYWNASHFGDATQNFYNKNPQLCGQFTGDAIDFERVTLNTPSGYSTHWTSLQEARYYLAEFGLQEVVVEERGKGVLVAFRQSKK